MTGLRRIILLLLCICALPIFAQATPEPKPAEKKQETATEPVKKTENTTGTTGAATNETPGDTTDTPAESTDPATEPEKTAEEIRAAYVARIEDPESRELLARAEQHFFAKRYHIALKLFERVTEREPETALAYRYAGDIYLMWRELDAAEKNFQIARELSPYPEEESFRLGQVYYLQSNADAAMQAFEAALEARPNFHLCHFYLGLIAYGLKRDKDATITHWETYRRLAPDDAQGPQIDRALELLKAPNFSFAGEKDKIPEGTDSRVPYMPGRSEDEKSDNKGESIIELDDL